MKKKIAVLRANALGDFIFILPALQALRDAYPDGEIVLLGKELHRRLLEHRPSPVNRVEVIPPYPGVGEREDLPLDEALIGKFFEQMREENFDIAFQMHGGGEYSNPFVRNLGASLTVGSRSTRAEPLDISLPYSTYFSEILRYLELVGCIGVKAQMLEPKISVTENDLKEAHAVVGDTSGKPIAVIQPGASDPRRWWPAGKFRSVAETLLDMGYHVCFNGVQAEKHLVRRIIKGLEDHPYVQDLAGHLSLSALIGLLSRATVTISNDTGPLHLAYAVGTPSIGLYWAPNMITGTPMSLENSRPLIAWNTTCPLCGAPFRELANTSNCDHMTSFIDEITVEEVIQALNGLSEEKVRMAMEVAYL